MPINWRTHSDDLPERMTLQELLAFLGIHRSTLYRYKSQLSGVYPKKRNAFYSKDEAKHIMRIIRGL